MAEIKRSRAGQSFLTKPIGVVDVTTGADKAYAAKAETKRRIGEIAFDFAKKIQVSEGREWASEILVEDENGLRGYEKIPSHLGSYGQQEANRIYQKRYMDAFQNDTRAFAKQLRLEEKDPVRYEELFNDYVKQSLTDIAAQGGGDVAAIVAPNLYNIGKLHVNDIQAKALVVKEQQAKADYLSIVDMRMSDLAGLEGSDRKFAYDALIADINDSAIRDYGFTAAQVVALLDNAADENALSAFNEEAKGLSYSSLIAIQDRQQWPNLIKAGQFKETINLIGKFDATRLSEFNTRVSGIAQDRKVLDGQSNVVESLISGLKTGGLINDSITRNSMDEVLRYTTPFDALRPSQKQADIENNAGVPSSSLHTLAGSARAGFTNPADIISFSKRLAQIDAAQSAKGRGLREYFGGDLGKDMEALFSFTKAMGRMGDEDLVRAYQGRFERNSLENLQVARRNAGFEGRDDASLRDISEAYIEDKLSDLPYAAREEAVTQVGYMLTFETPGDIAEAVKDFASRAYRPSEFYELYSENNDYSKYINGPEVYFNNEELKVLRAVMMNVGRQTGADRFLEPIQSSASGATWMVYELDNRGAKNFIFDSNGQPAVLYSPNFKKSYAAQKEARIAELQFMRNTAVNKIDDEPLESVMRIID
jgi:hypothetical protein